MPIQFALVGATGVGKTNLSLSLAEKCKAEIICVDSRQLYKDFCIGTAQPTKMEMEKVTHHLVHFLSPEESYSAGQFCKDVRQIIEANPEKNFILVGGTGLYLQSLILGLPQIPTIDEKIKFQLNELLKKEGLMSLCQKAQEVDPVAMERISENDVQRIMRVLEVYMQTGERLSSIRTERLGGFGSIKTFFLDRPRDALYARINQRVEQMIQDGWLEEVALLQTKFSLTAPAWQSLGYKELLEVLNHKKTLSAIIDLIQKETRHFAKRQLTWFNHQIEAEKIDLSEGEFLAEKKILDYLHS
ncbi:MAG: tRNA (adenosine(37)-N6)-dimethylallyltransferase MiaA [Fibrobacter sp.]|jgi:tRNA dimethylallyltransferase|nr:tRNA (adenosine(37)-N6)-dimethylallyltransferase MiaA [Fibrobacter sp.]